MLNDLNEDDNSGIIGDFDNILIDKIGSKLSDLMTLKGRRRRRNRRRTN
jgi:hypothetical protein